MDTVMSDILTSPERQPFEWIEIDQPLCSLSYGVSACAASLGVTGANKCFNTRATCQDPDNYDQTEVLTLYFCKNQGKIPDDHQYEPYLQSAKLSPAKINPGGGNTSIQALGKRATLTVTLADHPHPDNIVDPYLDDRDYDPFERSTFWAKWRARNPYYMNRIIRHNSGFLDPNTDLVDADTLITRTFFITGFSGPSANNAVSIQAKDILSLAADEKAKAPAVSEGKLDADINDSVTSLVLKPSGIGDDYGYSGSIRIGREVMDYTRATGSDTLTVTRATNNTPADSHSEDDAVQECLIYSAQTPAQILEDLLTNYASVPSEYLNLAQWAEEEAEFLPRGYSTIITEPTGVSTLINEMCQQMYFTTYWDERVDTTVSPMEGGLLMRAVRPAQDEPITYLTDESNLLEGSIQWTDKDKELITQVWVRYAQIDPTEKLKKGSNFAALDIVADLDAETSERNDTSKVKEIYARWLSAADGAAATELGQKILARYSNIPKECTFKLDANDGGLWLADFINVTNRNNVDFTGLPLPISMQVTSAQETIQGTTFSYTAMEYAGGVIEDEPDVLSIKVGADLLNVNLLELFKDSYPAVTPISGDKIKFTIPNGVNIGGLAISSSVNVLGAGSLPSYLYQSNIDYDFSTSSLAYFSTLQRRYLSASRSFTIGQNYTNAQTASVEGVCKTDVFEIPLSTAVTVGDTEAGSVVWPEAWPSGVELTLVIESGATVLGEGGNASIAHLDEGSEDYNTIYGGDGGHAIDAGHPIIIKNFGIISGGGGAGANYVFVDNDTVGPYGISVCSGGGAGYNQSIAVNNMTLGDTYSNQRAVASGGDYTDNGYGGEWKNGIEFWGGGDGGGLAEDGNVGIKYNYVTEVTTTMFDKIGVAGDAISSGTSNITWDNKGDVRGAEN